MNGFINKQSLNNLSKKYAITLDEQALERFDIYAWKLVSWNKKVNLTSIIEPEDIVVKHFVDSLTVFHALNIPKGSKVIDVGTGAGFPGLAMLIARPDLNLTLLDSTGKKLNVIADILTNIGLEAQLLHARAEVAATKEEYREQFDFVTARAVANLRELSEYCLPFIKEGGFFISMKASKAKEEIDGARKAIKILGGEIFSIKSFELEGAGERNIIITRKISQTSTKYPRPSAKIAKNPLI